MVNVTVGSVIGANQSDQNDTGKWRPAAPLRATSAAGAGWTPAGGTAAATSTPPDPTPTRGEAGSRTSPAPATAAVLDAVAAAPATSSRAR
jgi:hypothetical protein